MLSITRQQLAREAAEWHRSGLISADRAGLLAARYGGGGLFAGFFAGPGRWLALLPVGAAAASLGLAAEASVGGALLAGAGAYALWLAGVRLSADPLGRHPWSGTALVTAGLAVAWLALLLLSMAGHGGSMQGFAATLVGAGVFALVTAYRFHLRWPLLLGLLLLIHGVGGWHGYFGHGGYWAQMAEPRLLAAAAAVAVAVGVWHEAVAERRLDRRLSGFGGLYLTAGLFYAGLALWFTALPEGAWGWRAAFAAVTAAQLAVGVWRQDRRWGGAGGLFVVAGVAALLFAPWRGSLSPGWGLLAGGAAMVLLGAVAERRRRAAAGADEGVRRELAALLRAGVIDGATYDTLAARYPLPRWGWYCLGGWLLPAGLAALAVGAAALGR